MNKTKKMIYISFLDAIFFAITYILYFNDMMNYVFVTSTITIIIFAYLVYLVFSKTDKKTLYNKKIKEILKTYDSILVYSDKKIKLEKENIVQVKTFESLLTAQEELKKPILYLEEKETNHFILNDENEMLIFTMKLNEEESEFEKEIQKYLETKNKKNKKKKRILNDLDNTTIIKLEDDKFYKVSPMKNNK